MATLKDVAVKARVSAGTVSNVLSGSAKVRPALRDRVLNAIEVLNYEPNHIARSLKSKQTHTLGMVIPDITNPFFPLLTRGAEDAALQHKYLLVTVNTDNQLEREQLALNMLRSRRMDGILLVMAPNRGNPAHIEAMVAAGVPVVCLDRTIPGSSISSVSADFIGGTEMCMRHLVSAGHERIAIITGNLQVQSAIERLQGYKNVLAESNIKLNPDLILEGDFRMESGFVLTKQLWLSGRQPTALFVSNGMMGLGAFRALRELGVHCPGQLAVAIFDDLPQAESFSPPITSVAQPAYEIGFMGAELLIEQIEGKRKGAPPVHIRLPAELKIRNSTSVGRAEQAREITGARAR